MIVFKTLGLFHLFFALHDRVNKVDRGTQSSFREADSQQPDPWGNSMRMLSVGRIAAVAGAALLLGLNLSAKAADSKSPVAISPTAPQRFELRMHHLHTGEDIDIVYRIGDTYIPEALDRLNHFLRDHRTQDVSHYDPREFDLLHMLMASLGRPHGIIDIVCGYRTPWSNNFLRTRSASTGVAEHSQHMLGKAIDIRVPGVSTVTLRNAALALHAGGVGFYPVSQFVHVDVGPVREWSYR
jgi:uncharacterized protein YcbK (DUF882 family)